MHDYLYDAYQLIRFASEYWMQKCLRTMLFAMLAVLFVMLLRAAGKGRNASLDYYSLLLILPAAASGMSRLYFKGRMLYLNAFISEIAVTGIGYLYFGIMLLLLGAYFILLCRQARRIGRCPRLEEDGRKERAIAAVTASPLVLSYLRRTRIYLSDRAEGPFSGGIISPYIVLSERAVRMLSERELFTILVHELVHIRRGHILFLRLYDLAVIWWWGNPVFYLCRGLLFGDMELVCDEECIGITGMSEKAYASLMLDLAEKETARTFPENAFFARKSDYALLKRRIRALSLRKAERVLAAAGGEEAGDYRQRIARKRGATRTALLAAAFGLLLFVYLTSYPRYTKTTELALYNEALECVAYNTPELRQAVRAADGALTVTDKALFQRILAENGITDEYVYLSFDGIMKTPGAGGGGDTGMIRTDDPDEIFYLAAKTRANRIMLWLLKLM